MEWSLSNGNPISILALNVAILSLFAAVVLVYIDKTFSASIREVRSKQELMGADSFFLKGISNQASRCIAMLDALFNIQHVILRHILSGRLNDEKVINVYIRNFWQQHRLFQLNFQTLLLYTKHLDWKRSAIKQLSEDLGNAETLRRLLELKEHERDLCEDLLQAINALEKRIDEKLDSK